MRTTYYLKTDKSLFGETMTQLELPTHQTDVIENLLINRLRNQFDHFTLNNSRLRLHEQIAIKPTPSKAPPPRLFLNGIEKVIGGNNPINGALTIANFFEFSVTVQTIGGVKKASITAVCTMPLHKIVTMVPEDIVFDTADISRTDPDREIVIRMGLQSKPASEISPPFTISLNSNPRHTYMVPLFPDTLLRDVNYDNDTFWNFKLD